MSRAVMQQALEVLEGLADYRYTDRVKNTMASLRAALAEPEQEPVAWVCEGSFSDEKHAIDYWPGDVDDLPIGTKLYTAPTPRKPLTNEECDSVLLALDEWARDLDHYEYGLPLYNEGLREKAREVIRAAHGIGETK